METWRLIGIGVMAVLAVLYLMRRRSRLSREDVD
jgi:hypothetical protein